MERAVGILFIACCVAHFYCNNSIWPIPTFAPFDFTQDEGRPPTHKTYLLIIKLLYKLALYGSEVLPSGGFRWALFNRKNHRHIIPQFHFSKVNWITIGSCHISSH